MLSRPQIITGKLYALIPMLLQVALVVSSQAGARSHCLNRSPQDISSEIARLAAHLNSSDEEERYDAVLMLSALETPAAVPALESALTDRSEKVRAVAIGGLARTGDSSVIPDIAALLARDNKVFVRKAAAYGLGLLGTQAGTAALVNALRDKNNEVRAAAAVALGKYADASAIEPLRRALSDKSEFVREHAAEALGVNGRAAVVAVAALVRLLVEDSNHAVKRRAATALGRIGDPSALPALNRAERDPDPYLSLAALEAIKMIKQPQR